MAYPIPNALTLESKTIQQRRIAIQGWSGTGKTTSAITFPNPAVIDIDHQIDEANARAAGRELKDVAVIPYYDDDFIDALVPQRGGKQKFIKGQANFASFSPNRRDAMTKWLDTYGPKLEADQTLILDSWTTLQDWFDIQTTLEPAITKKGELDDFDFWERKQEFSRDVLVKLASIKCTVVVIFHEVQEQDDKGRNTGKVRPLMQGKFVNKLSKSFTDWFRQIAIDKKCDEQTAKSLDLPLATLQAYCDDTKSDTLRLWQTQASSLADCKTKLIGVHRFVPAHYKVFEHPENYQAK